MREQIEALVRLADDWERRAGNIRNGCIGPHYDANALAECADELRTRLAAIAQGVGEVDDAMVDRFWRFWSDHLNSGKGGRILMYRDVRGLLTAALTPQQDTGGE